jgi:hypothetical protein
MADWKNGARSGLASLGALVGLALLIVAAVQAWRDGLEARGWATLAALVAAVVLAVTWKRIEPASRAVLSATLVVLTIGALAVIHGPGADDAFAVGPLSLAALAALAILLSGLLSLVVLLVGSRKLAPGWRIGLALLGLLLLAPFGYGVWRGLPLAELYSGPGFLAPLPRWCQPAVIGAVLLLPVSLVFLVVALVKAARSEERSTLRPALLVLCAAAPLGVAVHGLVVQPADGLAMRTFAERSWDSLLDQEIARRPTLRWDGPPAGASADFWVEWEGALHVAATEERRFELVGESVTGYLFLDGVRLLAEPGMTGVVELEEGLHRLRIAAIPTDLSGHFDVRWALPGGIFEPIPGELLSHDGSDAKWRRTPRQAAQVGLEWLQSSALDWQRRHRCFGCHVQAHALMGMRVARDNRYDVNLDAWTELADFTRQVQRQDGTWHGAPLIAATQYAAMALAHAGPPEGEAEDPALLRAVEWLDGHQLDDGELPIDIHEPPIDQGSLMTTSNGVFAFRAVSGLLSERRWHRAADSGMQWIRTQAPETTQDRVMQLLAFGRETGTGRLAERRVHELLDGQQDDGSWTESQHIEEGNAYATGQALYGLKRSGRSVTSPPFARGVRFLMHDQRVTGEWPSANTGSRRPSDFAPTMWAVIGLAGSFGELMPEIVEPANGAAVQGPTQLVAEVSNFTDSAVREVRFSIDGLDLGPAVLEPVTGRWLLDWDATGAAEGRHEVLVVATAGTGLSAEHAIAVHVGVGVLVSLESPEQDGRLGRTQRVTARAEGLLGQQVARVEFLVDGQPVGEVTEVGQDGLWSIDWETRGVAVGHHQVEAVATTDGGQQAQDEVGVVKEAPLAVRIEEPTTGARVAGAQPCVAEVRVDPALQVDRLTWYLDGTPFARAMLPDAAGAPIRAVISCDFAGVLPGEYDLVVVAEDGTGHRAEDRVRVLVGEAPGPGYLRVQLEDPDRPGEQLLFFAPDQVELILDMSGSMWGRVPGGTKADVAREVLGGLVGTLPRGTALGLRVYGHRRKRDCDDIELLVPVGPADGAALRRAMAGLEPTGMTPIDRALRQAAEELTGLPGSKAIVLVTDGVESCEGDPVAAARSVVEAGIGARVHVVGFDVGDTPEAIAQLRSVAEAGGGSFFLAGDAEQLRGALEEAVTLSWSVFDEAAQPVMSRSLSLESHQLMSGTYRLELQTEPPVVLEGLRIERDRVTVVDVAREGEGFRLQLGE